MMSITFFKPACNGALEGVENFNTIKTIKTIKGHTPAHLKVAGCYNIPRTMPIKKKRERAGFFLIGVGGYKISSRNRSGQQGSFILKTANSNHR